MKINPQIEAMFKQFPDLKREAELTTNVITHSSDDQTYNVIFNYRTGFTARCGKLIEEDPNYSPIGPEILDMEISTICHGIKRENEIIPVPCDFCYKSNSPIGENMSFATFKRIFDNIPPNLVQIAFGIGDIEANPDMWRIMEYCQHNDKHKVIPNTTLNGWNLTDDSADRFASLCGAIAVSHYDDNVCFNAIKMLTDRGMTQVNIHQLVAEETFEECLHVLKMILVDSRLEKLNAIVFLSLKQKGRGKTLTPLSLDKFRELIEFAFRNNIRIGFDSCTSLKLLQSIQNRDDFGSLAMMIESCESFLFSGYCNVKGEFFPCSFIEGEKEWQEGINAVECNDFLHEVWMHPRFVKWRKNLIASKNTNEFQCRTCPVFRI